MDCRAKLTIVLVIATLGSVVGCESSPTYDDALRADTSITSLRAQLESAKESMNGTMGALNDLVQNPAQDLRPQYQRFVSSLAALESQAEQVKSHARDMRGRAEQYFSAWKQRAQQIQDESLRATSTERRDQVMGLFTKLTDATQKLSATWTPFIEHLHDVKKYLDTDLSPGSLAAAKGIISSTVADSKQVSSAVDGVVAELDQVSQTLSAGKVAPPPPPTAPAKP